MAVFERTRRFHRASTGKTVDLKSTCLLALRCRAPWTPGHSQTYPLQERQLGRLLIHGGRVLRALSRDRGWVEAFSESGDSNNDVRGLTAS